MTLVPSPVVRDTGTPPPTFPELLHAGLGAGLLAGSFLGLIAAITILLGRKEGADMQVLWYGPLLHAILLGAAGLTLGAAAGLLGRRRPSRDAFVAFSLPALVCAVGFVIARFHIYRDVLGEHPMSRVQQLALVGVTLIFFICTYLALRWLAGRRVPHPLLRTTTHAALAAAILIAGGAGSILLRPAVVPPPRPPDHVPAGLADRPNVILIMVDTLRADRLPAYGYKRIATPVIDALAADGAVFEHAFSQASWTKPSTATLLTGLYPSTHQTYRKSDVLPASVTTVAEAMKDAGWRTGAIVSNINLAPSFGFDQGTDEYLYLAPDYFFGASESSSKLALYNLLRLVRERFLSKRKDVRHYYQDAPAVTGAAKAWLDRNGRTRFFLFLHYMDPHDPYFVHPYDGTAVARVDTPRPEASRAREISDLYDGEIVFLDRYLGALISDLKAKGLYESTLIVLTADHGEEFCEHGGWWHGTTLYDEQIRIPLIVKPPREGGTPVLRGRIGGIARSLDISPTILTLCRLHVPPEMQGVSLEGGAAGSESFAEEDFEGNRLRALRTPQWKIIQANAANPRGLPEEELFDVAGDPRETQNLALTQMPLAKAMNARMDRRVAAALRSAVVAEHGRLDAQTRERLKALGYVQ
ncbi:MAG: hypothetical protein A2Y95_09335 [Deltaproteobacteria bacterium RBG_13_65_10]|nr:MAG: hypothetical protein A2Y95_09335 [Deltaproteobacteria bacterium RBG_13_65_10]